MKHSVKNMQTTLIDFLADQDWSVEEAIAACGATMTLLIAEGWSKREDQKLIAEQLAATMLSCFENRSRQN